jgi:hypothetical protein
MLPEFFFWYLYVCESMIVSDISWGGGEHLSLRGLPIVPCYLTLSQHDILF